MSYDYTTIQLPSNWEQQYDVPSNRFFFIDHVNKVTTWVDPRIEIYKKKQQETESKKKSAGTPNTKGQTSATVSPISFRDKRAKDIQSKYSKVALSRIKQLLEENFDNVSSVESILNREVQLAHDKEVMSKIEEVVKKAETEKHLKEEQEAKMKKEDEKKSKIMKENSKKDSDKEVKLKSGESSKSQSVREKNFNENSMDKIKKTGLIEDHPKENTKMELSKENIREESKPRLDKGPNKSILSGPNPKNKIGPNQDFIKEKESLAKGADTSNYVGSKGNFGIKAS